MKFLNYLQEKTKNTNLGRFLFNKYYNLIDFKWNLFYTFWFAVAAGIGNAVPGLNDGFSKIIFLFIQGFINNATLGIFINVFYGKTVTLLQKTKHPRINSNIFAGSFQIIFLVWHYAIGTENPLQTMIFPLIMAFIVTNYHVTKEQKN